MQAHPVATGLSPLRSLSGPFILFIALFAFPTATPSRRVSGQTATTSTIWLATEVPSVPADPEVASGELGLRFRSDVDGVIAGIRFYKASTNTGTHVANLWTGTGTKLATATFTNETASGWQQANFPTRVAVTAGTVYVASYHMNVGHYSDDEYYFTGHGLDRPPLHALADGESGPNGVYATGAASAFPTLGWHASELLGRRRVHRGHRLVRRDAADGDGLHDSGGCVRAHRLDSRFRRHRQRRRDRLSRDRVGFSTVRRCRRLDVVAARHLHVRGGGRQNAVRMGERRRGQRLDEPRRLGDDHARRHGGADDHGVHDAVDLVRADGGHHALHRD